MTNLRLSLATIGLLGVGSLTVYFLMRQDSAVVSTAAAPISAGTERTHRIEPAVEGQTPGTRVVDSEEVPVERRESEEQDETRGLDEILAIARKQLQMVITPDALPDVDFSRSGGSKMYGVWRSVERSGLSAAELTRVYRALDAEDSLRRAMLLGLPYANGVDDGDLAFLSDLANSPSGNGRVEELAALHAFDVLARKLGAEDAMADSVVGQLATLQSDPSAHASVTKRRSEQLGLALGLLNTPLTQSGVSSLIDAIDEESLAGPSAGAAYAALARVGGNDGAHKVIEGARAGTPEAIAALAELRDPIYAPELKSIAQESLANASGLESAAASIAGLLSTDPDQGLAFVDELLEPLRRGDEIPEFEFDALTAAFASVRGSRNRGTFNRLYPMLLDLGYDERERWSESLNAMSKASSFASWFVPLESEVGPMREGMRDAIEHLPPGSKRRLSAFYDLARIASHEDEAFLRSNLDTVSNGPAIIQALEGTDRILFGDD